MGTVSLHLLSGRDQSPWGHLSHFPSSWPVPWELPHTLLVLWLPLVLLQLTVLFPTLSTMWLLLLLLLTPPLLRDLESPPSTNRLPWSPSKCTMAPLTSSLDTPPPSTSLPPLIFPSVSPLS